LFRVQVIGSRDRSSNSSKRTDTLPAVNGKRNELAICGVNVQVTTLQLLCPSLITALRHVLVAIRPV